jgi:hypothetical protein
MNEHGMLSRTDDERIKIKVTIFGTRMHVLCLDTNQIVKYEDENGDIQS